MIPHVPEHSSRASRSFRRSGWTGSVPIQCNLKVGLSRPFHEKCSKLACLNPNLHAKFDSGLGWADTLQQFTDIMGQCFNGR